MSAPSRVTTRPPATDDRYSVPVRGVHVGPEARCAHYDGPRDVVAIRFPCCDVYYPCFKCHEAVEAHRPDRLAQDRLHEPAVLCGVCRETISAATYLQSGHMCPHCDAPFNPNCAGHRESYFALD